MRKRCTYTIDTCTHTHTRTDVLTVPAAMGMENTEVQGHFKYSAAWGSPLSVYRILLLTRLVKKSKDKV